MRKLLLTLFCLVPLAVLAEDSPSRSRMVVDLDRPTVMKRLRNENRELYQQIVGIMRLPPTSTEPEALQWVQTRGGVEPRLSSVWRVSNPPKRRINFTIGETEYSFTYTVRDLNARPQPANTPGGYPNR
jgi:hypothetical protein